MDNSIPQHMQTQYIESPTGQEKFDALADFDPNAAKEPSKQPIGEENGVQGADNEEADSKESKEEGNEEEVTSEAASEKVEEGSKGGDPTKSEVEKQAVEVKSVTASLGDKEYSVPEDAAIKFRVDGKEVSVSIAELRKNYQGKIPWDRHYAESKEMARKLEEEKSSFQAFKGKIDGHLEDILKTFDTNPYLAFEKIAVLKGKNPADFLPVYIAQSKKTLDELSKLSEAEFKALTLQRRNDFERTRLETEKKEVDAVSQANRRDRELRDADAYFEQKARELNFTAEEIQNAQKVASESKVDFTKLTPRQIADLMVDFIQNTERPYSRVEKVAHSVDPKLLENRELIGHIRTLVNDSFTESDIAEILKEYIRDSQPKPAPKAQVPSVETQSNGTHVPGSNGANGARAGQKGEPKAGVNGKQSAGMYMSMDDILKEYV